MITILSCVVLLRRQIHKPVEPILNGQPVLSGQLAIPQGRPFNTGLTVLLLLLLLLLLLPDQYTSSKVWDQYPLSCNPPAAPPKQNRIIY